MKGERTVSELAAGYGVHPAMIHQWKKALLDGATESFGQGGKKPADMDGETVRSLHARIGELAVVNDVCPESSSRGPASEPRSHEPKIVAEGPGRPQRMAMPDDVLSLIRLAGIQSIF